MDITVAGLIVQYIERLGVEHVFGIPGAHILPVFDALFDSSITTVLSKHEQGASFMAGGYARQSGKPGVCIATAGPGATNLVTGLANAYMDRLPVLAITGETPTYSFGKGALQESTGEGTSISQFDLFRGITRYHTVVQRTDYLLNIFRTVTGILIGKKPQPVLLSFPYNVLKETVNASLLDGVSFSVSIRSACYNAVPLEEMVRFLQNSRYPVVVSGYGAIESRAESDLACFCETLNIPLATTLKARGILPESSPLSLGVLGITGNNLAFKYISEQADLVIIAGASFGERTSYNWNSGLLDGKKIVQIDIDEAQLNKVFTADIAIHEDVQTVFNNLFRKIETAGFLPKDEAAISSYRSKYCSPEASANGSVLVSRFMGRLYDRLNATVSIFDDNIIYMQRFCSITKSRTYFPNSGLSSLGHAIPAAIGARLATGNPVIAVLGDGGFQMCCMELMTAVNHQIPVTVILLNNSSLGLVRKNQFHNYHSRFIASEFINPDYEKLSSSFGIEYFRVESPDDAVRVADQVDIDKINLVELILDKDEFPLYASGR